MFIDFFYLLRKEGIPVSTIEFLDLLKVLLELHKQKEIITLERFYIISRSILIKDTKYYHKFHQVFKEYFKEHINIDIQLIEKILEEWLNEQKAFNNNLKNAPYFDKEELFKEFLKRLQEQKEEHHGGTYWIGTGGASPFGHSGKNPQGIRIGGNRGSGTAIDKFGNISYEEYNPSEVFNIRQYKVALKKLRQLRKTGNLQINIKETVQKTSKNLGDPEIIFERLKKNQISLILLMDVGGSMEPYIPLVNRFFSACYKLRYFKEFYYYYFHNTLYEWLFKDAKFKEKLHIEDFFKKYNKNYKIIFIGDACMNPYELFDKRHAFFEYYYKEDKPLSTEELAKKQAVIKNSYQRLKEFKKNFPSSVWLNPQKEFTWQHETIEAIREIFPMYFLNLNGIENAIKKLLEK
ncbi:MAG: hypothetical protein KatS3mg129_2171 [Leptospiraceae bacterium]|nr:MAG: hypothetical protein KatS3mg129_2171 [Leptospiraceae bacterium]